MSPRVSSMLRGALAAAALAVGAPLAAHHSLAMYDQSKIYVFTGVVTRVHSDASHLQLFFVPLNYERTSAMRDAKGEPITWSVEMDGAAKAAGYGVSVNTFPPGTVFSVALFPLRSGKPAGGRGKNGLYRCPDDVVPPPGKHCDSVPGGTARGPGVLPASAPIPSELGGSGPSD